MRGAAPGRYHVQLPALARRTGDFPRWKEHDAYGKALERLPRDLKVEAGRAANG